MAAKKTNLECTFRLFPTKTKSHTITHTCASMDEAMAQLFGMQYAQLTEHKHPKAELWYNGTLMKRIYG